MVSTIELGDIAVEVVKKDIKNIHLSVHPPTGRVRISAPLRMDLELIRVFAISKLGWIKRHQKKQLEQERETLREYLDRESHYVWGRRYLLSIVEDQRPPAVDLNHNKLQLSVRPGTGLEKMRAIMDDWYRDKLKQAVPPLLAKWEPLMGVNAERFFVQKMKTKWGSCNAAAKTIRLNTQLAKKPPQCLEYIVVHELVHFLERHHNDRFVDLMNRFLPQWKEYRNELNAIPLAHETWSY
jgi:predicted metal-dependent hydrolase